MAVKYYLTKTSTQNELLSLSSLFSPLCLSHPTQFGSIVQQPKAAIDHLKKELTEGSTTGHIAYKPKGKRIASEDSVGPLKAACQVDIHVASRATTGAPVLPGDDKGNALSP